MAVAPPLGAQTDRRPRGKSAAGQGPVELPDARGELRGDPPGDGRGIGESFLEEGTEGGEVPGWGGRHTRRNTENRGRTEGGRRGGWVDATRPTEIVAPHRYATLGNDSMRDGGGAPAVFPVRASTSVEFPRRLWRESDPPPYMYLIME